MTSDLADLHFKPALLKSYGLPDMGYPLPSAFLVDILNNDGQLPLAVMLLGLQLKCAGSDGDRVQIEAAMQQIALLLSPEDKRHTIDASGDTWWLEIGPVNLSEKLIAIQRGEDVIACLSPRNDGRLRAATYRPLDAKSASLLLGLSRNPHPVHGVQMRQDNWEFALDCSVAMGQVYADMRGEAYLSFWESGLGINSTGGKLNPWYLARQN